MTEPKKNKGTKAAISPTKSILGDRRIRLLLSVIGAIIAWMAVTIVVQPGTTTTITTCRWISPTILRPILPGG